MRLEMEQSGVLRAFIYDPCRAVDARLFIGLKSRCRVVKFIKHAH